MKINLNFKAIVPCNGTNDDYAPDIEQYNLTINEMNEIFGKELFDFESLKIQKKINFKVCDKSNQPNYLLFFFGKPYSTVDKYFTFSFEVELDVESEQVLKIDHVPYLDKNTNDLSMVKILIAWRLREIIYEISLCANIARPNSLGIFEGLILLDESNYMLTDSLLPMDNEEYELSPKFKYPNLSTYSIEEIRRSFCNNNISLNDYKSDDLSKAINCLTYIYSPESSDPEKLIYCLIALESIYTKGNINVSEQLDEKIQIYLGPLNEFKKTIKEIYALRSRFLHGDLTIKPQFLYSNTDGKDYDDSIYDSLLIAIKILTATIQKMLFENRTHLDFKYVLK
jgi:hypothetical protein